MSENSAWKHDLLSELIKYLIKLFEKNYPNELIENDIW